MDQSSLFGDGPVEASIAGLIYQPEFLSPDEEASLIDIVRSLPLHAARYKGYLALRRVVSFGGSYDFDTNELLPAQPLDARLLPLRERVAQWAGIEAGRLVHALVAEYAPGTPLGWHRDVPDFERIVGVSLGGAARLRFRPYPYSPSMRRQVVALDAQPRSIYRMEGDARWQWQHSVEPTRELRWSITFRERREPGRGR
ncbi:alpha-ketoglutarate-dependent dioxygenase AlkB [Cupriavidus respiraculi]|uniref:alpha-ketoglutarate-dependent dioxygenase AlkB n=1 Tax=Cupriavidus respiraculi TaxID=195930 RepID=UPI001C972270|nr:alpha-ketoglutarate-dependent dioxygenase AlkB [Cupriavidus respiraculi]MBY4945051.1 alpha-ketoglutarate-dependent dioxygenase AlkB [Cupriavidus respiraculi]